MKNQRKVSCGLIGAAFVVLAAIMSANCSSNKANPMPGKAGSGGGAGTSGAGGVTGTGGTSASAGTGGATGASGAGGGAPDGGTGDAGDAAMACDASAVSPDAGCMACSTDPLFACPGVPTTCYPFKGTVPTVPRL